MIDAAQARQEGRPFVPALAARGVRKAFGATQALRGVDLALGAGEIHGLVGENGSGKSTLVKILSGVYVADGGTLDVGGSQLDAAAMTPAEARALGIRVVHQDAPAFGSLTVAENLALGRHFPTRVGGSIDHAQMRREAAAALERFRIPARPRDLVRDLNPAVRAMIAIARALFDREQADGGVLILDEPTAGLSEAEVAMLLDAIRRYARDGQAIGLVTHRLDEILGACDRVTVLRDGAVVETLPRAELTRTRLVSLMIGEPLGADGERVSASAGVEAGDGGDAEPAARAERLRLDDVHAERLNGVAFSVGEGEIVSLFGLLGAGAPEVLQAIYGARPLTGGAVRLDGAALAPAIGTSLKRRIAYVPADRVGEANFNGRSVADNLGVSEVRSYWRRGRMDRRRERADAARWLEAFDVHPRDPEVLISNLSGGNQQKVVVARALRREPRLLLMDEPTQGVDVGARAQIHQAIRDAADAGTTVVVVSSDLEEVLALSRRILVLVAGRVVADLTGTAINRSDLLHLAHQERAHVSQEERYDAVA